GNKTRAPGASCVYWNTGGARGCALACCYFATICWSPKRVSCLFSQALAFQILFCVRLEPLPALRTLHVLKINSRLLGRCDAGIAVRAGDVEGLENLLQIEFAMAGIPVISVRASECLSP